MRLLLVRAVEANLLLPASYDVAWSAVMVVLLLAVLMTLAVIVLGIRRRRQSK